MATEYNTLSFYVDLLALLPLLWLIVITPVPAFLKRLVFVAAGIYLLFFIAPRVAVFYVVAWLLVFLLQNLVAVFAERRIGLTLFWSGVLVLLAPMVVWKLTYTDFNIAFNLWGNAAIELFSPDLFTIDLARQIVIPIGLSFATFRAIDLLVKTYLGQINRLSLDRVLFFGFFAPVQIIGPVIQYTEIQRQADNFAGPSAEDVYQGALRIAIGMFKVTLIAVVLQPSSAVFTYYESYSTIMVWGLLFVYTWYFYINFSGYSDIAIGTSRVLGFRLLENFSYPYFQKNVADYWNNWHMSLSHFAQRNVYVPMGGYRKKTQYHAIFATIMVIALWHNITVGMVVFGLYHGTGLVAHRYWSQRERAGTYSQAFPWLNIAGTYLFVVLGFPLLMLPLIDALQFYGALLGI